MFHDIRRLFDFRHHAHQFTQLVNLVKISNENDSNKWEDEVYPVYICDSALRSACPDLLGPEEE
eukprot:1921853-Rhodomonas_salina.1